MKTGRAHSLSIKAIYEAFRAEVKARKLGEDRLEYYHDNGEDEYEDNQEWGNFVYSYNPVSTDELAFRVAANVDGDVYVQIGPIWVSASFSNDTHHTSNWWGRQCADIVQMALNGQFALLLTTGKKTSEWQAAELVWTDENKNERVIATLSNHAFSRRGLSAQVLRNSDAHTTVKLSKDSFLCPVAVNRRLVLGRGIDLSNPTPLTRKEFNTLDHETLPVQLMGGDEGEKIWSIFYKRIEFWVVTALALALYFYLTETYLKDDVVAAVLRPVSGVVTTLVIVFSTGVLLTRRQQAVDAGRVPLGERIEDILKIPLFVLVVLTSIITALYTAPVWTPIYDKMHLYSAMQLPGLFLLPVTIVAVLYVVSLIAVARRTTGLKIIRFLLFAAGLGLTIYTNTAIGYGGDDAAAVSDMQLAFVLYTPALIAFFLLVDVFIKPQAPQIHTWEDSSPIL